MKKALIAIIIFAFLLRLTGLFFGLPYSDVYGDEISHTITAFKIMDAKSPIVPFGASYLPPLFAYLLAPVYGLIGFGGIIIGAFENLADFKEFVILYKEWFLAPGRLISALFGIAAIYLLFLFAKKVFDGKVALLSVGLLAIDFMHVHESQIGHIWGPIAFFAVAGAYCFYSLYLTGQKKWYWLSALAMGLGYAIGQVPVIFYPFFLVSHGFSAKKAKERFWSKKFLLSNALFFGIVALFTLLNFYTFYKHFYDVALAFLKLFGLDSSLLPAINWSSAAKVADFSLIGNWRFIFESLFYNSPFVFLAAIFGLLLLLKKHRLFDPKTILLIIFPFVYLAISSFIYYHFVPRYVLPAVPFLIVLASYFAFWLIEKPFFSKAKAFWLALFVAVLGWHSLAQSGLYSLKLLRPYTASQAVEWVYKNVPSSSRIVSDIYLNTNRQGIEFLQKYNMYNWVDNKKSYLLAQKDENYPRPNYFLIDTNLTDVISLSAQERKADYVFMFFYDKKEEDQKRAILDAISGKKELAARFYPELEKRDIKKLLNWEIQNSLPALWRADYIGPYVEIYKIK